MGPLAQPRSTGARRTLGRVAALAALAAGLGLAAPGTATAATPAAPVRAAAVSPEVEARRPVVLQRIVAINTTIVQAKKNLASSDLPAKTLRPMVRALTSDQTTLAVAAVRTVTARTMPQLDRAETLAESVAPAPAAASVSADELRARADAVIALAQELRPRQVFLIGRAEMGEYYGFDPSYWADPVRRAAPLTDQAEDLAAGAKRSMDSTGTATAQDEADVTQAESLIRDAENLTIEAEEKWNASNAN